MPSPETNRELPRILVGPIGADRWREYRNLRLQALIEEPIAFEDPDQGIERLQRRSEREWRAMLEGIPHDPVSAEKLIILGAESDGKLVGAINAIIYRPPHAEAALIQNVYVAQSSRGQHLGRQLMDAIIAQIRNFPAVQKAQLDVFATQTEAIQLYESVGFKVMDHIPNAKNHEGRQIDKLHMELDLQK